MPSTRLLLPAFTLAALAGYVGPWVNHPAAGLVITGLDLAELVKFLAPVQSGAIAVTRELFYLPLAAASLTLSLHAYRRELAYAWPWRALLLAAAVVAALNLLPPAWTPALLRAPEFRIQVVALIALLGCVLISPILALLPGRAAAAIAALAALAALIFPSVHFLRILPAVEEVYRRPLSPGWGFWLATAGLAALAVLCAAAALKGQEARTRSPR